MTFSSPMAAGFLAFGLTAAGAASAAEPQRIGAWAMTCETGMCQAYMTITAEGRDILSWTVTANPDLKLVSMILSTPTGVALPPGLRFWTGAAQSFDVPYQVCDDKACTAVAVVDPLMRASLSNVTSVRMSYFLYGQPDPTVFDVSVEGFADAVKALETPKQ